MTPPPQPANYLLGFSLLAILCAQGLAEDRIITRDRHPWGAFRPGSWKLVKVTTETFGPDGKSTGKSVTETRSMLVSADAASYELQIDVTVDVGGKRIASPPRTTRQGFQGEGEGQTAAVRKLGETELKIGDRLLRVQNAELEIADKDLRKDTLVSYAPGMQPYILGRRSVVHDGAGKLLQETIVETKALQVPRTILGFRRTTWQTKTMQKHPAGTILTDEVHCFDIPGGVVEHTSEELDEKGNLLSRSKLELVNFGIATGDLPPRKRIPKRKSRRG